MELEWKPNWPEARRHYEDWWRGRGFVIGMWGAPPADSPRDAGCPYEPALSLDQRFTDPAARARRSHAYLAGRAFPGDIFPMTDVDTGPGSLALYLGSEPTFAESTVWFHPCLDDICRSVHFNPANRWWQLTLETLRQTAALGRGRYLTGCPDLVEGLDTLASLRGSEALLYDLAERPKEVSARLEEITRAWFEVYGRIYEIIHQPDGSSTFHAFYVWGPGKTAKLQCDISAMISPRMFRRFVAPVLSRQCAWLDASLYHLDGHQCLVHLDTLLSIDRLGAIEWTPDPSVPPGGSPEWYPLYRKILAAGKSVQAVGVKPEEVNPLLEAVGPNGLYIMTQYQTEQEARDVAREVQRFRKE